MILKNILFQGIFICAMIPVISIYMFPKNEFVSSSQVAAASRMVASNTTCPYMPLIRSRVLTAQIVFGVYFIFIHAFLELHTMVAIHVDCTLLNIQQDLLRMEDAVSAFRNWMSDENVTEFLRWKPHRSIEETKDTMLKWTALYTDSAFYQWAIELKEIHEPIGTISRTSFRI